jgi:hypothetical protein
VSLFHHAAVHLLRGLSPNNSDMVQTIYCAGHLQFATVLVPVIPSLHHLNLPKALAVHPQPILTIPGKILSSPSSCCDPFFYFTTPLHLCCSLQRICHNTNVYFWVPQTSEATTQISHDGKTCTPLFKNTYYYSKVWFTWQWMIQKALLTENLEDHYSSLFHLLTAPSTVCLPNSKWV